MGWLNFQAGLVAFGHHNVFGKGVVLQLSGRQFPCGKHGYLDMLHSLSEIPRCSLFETMIQIKM